MINYYYKVARRGWRRFYRAHRDALDMVAGLGIMGAFMIELFMFGALF